MKPNPGCPGCHGHGGRFVSGRFVLCACVKASQSALRAQHLRRVNDPNYRSIRQRDQDQRRER